MTFSKWKIKIFSGGEKKPEKNWKFSWAKISANPKHIKCEKRGKWSYFRVFRKRRRYIREMKNKPFEGVDLKQKKTFPKTVEARIHRDTLQVDTFRGAELKMKDFINKRLNQPLPPPPCMAPPYVLRTHRGDIHGGDMYGGSGTSILLFNGTHIETTLMPSVRQIQNCFCKPWAWILFRNFRQSWDFWEGG